MKNINEYKKRFYNLMESTLGDVKPLISEQDEGVSDLERKEQGDKMMKDWIDLHYMNQVFNKEKNRPYLAFNNNGKLDYDMAYREHMASIDDDLKDLGFPYTFNIPEGITRDEFESLKKRWDDTISKSKQNTKSFEDAEELTLERQLFVKKMVDEYIKTMYLTPGASDVVGNDGKSLANSYTTNGVLDPKKIYHFKGDEMDSNMVRFGFPDGFHIPENISRSEFEKYKTKWENTLKILKYKVSGTPLKP